MIPAALPLLPLLLQSPAAISCGPCFVMLPGPCTGGTRGRRRHCMLAGAAGTSAPPRWSEVRISESPIDKPLGEEDPGETLKRGETVVLLPRIASLDACAALVDTCLRETKAERLGCEDVESPALVRRVLDDLPADVRTACESILSGVLARLDAQLPSVAAAHFPDESRSLSELLAGNALEWAWREPAVIVYSQGSDGYAQTPHFDGQARPCATPPAPPAPISTAPPPRPGLRSAAHQRTPRRTLPRRSLCLSLSPTRSETSRAAARASGRIRSRARRTCRRRRFCGRPPPPPVQWDTSRPSLRTKWTRLVPFPHRWCGRRPGRRWCLAGAAPSTAVCP